MTITFRAIKAEVLDRMVRGDWPPGTLLPGEESLAAQFGCARTTVNRALRELAEEGYLDRKRKSGTRVLDVPERQARFPIPLIRREVEAAGKSYGYQLLSRDIASPPSGLRPDRADEDGRSALHLVCLHSADGAPYQLEDRWIDLSTLPQAADVDFAQTTPNAWLIATVPYSDVEISFTAVSADAATARTLGCERHDALFRVERATWFSRQPVTLVRLTYAPGHRLTTRY